MMLLPDSFFSIKVTVLSTWTFEDFKAVIEEDIISSLSDINLQVIFLIILLAL